jgi:hypothetical protein
MVKKINQKLIPFASRKQALWFKILSGLKNSGAQKYLISCYPTARFATLHSPFSVQDGYIKSFKILSGAKKCLEHQKHLISGS